MEKITFLDDGTGDRAEFYVLEQTRLNGETYILVTDSEEEEAECLILKERSSRRDSESIYEIVQDDEELDAVSEVFQGLLEDVVIE